MADRKTYFGEVSSIDWHSAAAVISASWTCGYCSSLIASATGFFTTKYANDKPCMRICPNCSVPTFFDAWGRQFPSALIGQPVQHVPDDLSSLYDEARRSSAAGAHTAAVLVCRKMLAHIAVDKKAEGGQPFIKYVEYLSDKGYVPPDGKAWVDYVRRRANQATHEIVLLEQADAEALIAFVGALLRFIYELPQMIPTAAV